MPTFELILCELFCVWLIKATYPAPGNLLSFLTLWGKTNTGRLLPLLWDLTELDRCRRRPQISALNYYNTDAQDHTLCGCSWKNTATGWTYRLSPLTKCWYPKFSYVWQHWICVIFHFEWSCGKITHKHRGRFSSCVWGSLWSLAGVKLAQPLGWFVS